MPKSTTAAWDGHASISTLVTRSRVTGRTDSSSSANLLCRVLIVGAPKGGRGLWSPPTVSLLVIRRRAVHEARQNHDHQFHRFSPRTGGFRSFFLNSLPMHCIAARRAASNPFAVLSVAATCTLANFFSA